MTCDIKPEHYFYLASPYSHDDENVRYKRFADATEIGFQLTKLGLNLFCPITQSHTLNFHGVDEFKPEQALGHDECMRVDYAFLSRAKGLIVVKLDGWNESKGVALEIDYAIQNKMLIYFIRPDSDLQAMVKAIVNCDPKSCKGASKEGKPSTLNFPWAGYEAYDYIGKPMDMLICAILKKCKDKHILNVCNYLERFVMPYTNSFEVNAVFADGQQKHGLRSHYNYESSDILKLVDATGRHILKGLNNKDNESGIKHAAHVEANILMIKQIINQGR